MFSILASQIYIGYGSSAQGYLIKVWSCIKFDDREIIY
jgi:hypothetical protein